MSLSDIIRKLTVNPANILRIPRGRLGVGCAADLTIFDPDQRWTIDPEQFASKGRNTPFAGMQVRGKVKYTIVDGKIIYQDK
jgi:dihydroorotase